METKIEFTRINNDVNGKPRYVCHYLNFITDKDDEDVEALRMSGNNGISHHDL